MYAQQNGDALAPRENMQTFERGGVVVPANYKGNAFTLDEVPCEAQSDECEACINDLPEIQATPPRCPSEAKCQSECTPPKTGRGLLSGIFDRFSRGFELDDILLIGLIILLLQNDCDRRDETVILLALLLLGGF